jgi:tagatose 6-phosphate kinase
MITTITLNTAIDKTYYLSRFALNKLNRVDKQLDEPGGKGINVSKVLDTYNLPVTTSGFVGGYNGKFITSQLESRGFHHDFVQVNEESRCCLNIIDDENLVQTEIVEAGPTISQNEWEEMKKKVAKLSAVSQCMIFSGSLPKGLPSDAYSHLLRIAKGNGAKTFLDTSGEALSHSLDAIPFFIKPNEDELKNYLGKDQLTEKDVFQVMDAWSQKGISVIVVSRGEKGAFISYNGVKFAAAPPDIKAVNPVGCGDALVAGMAIGIYKQLPIEDQIKFSIAVSAAAAIETRAGSVSVDNVSRFVDMVSVKEII